MRWGMKGNLKIEGTYHMYACGWFMLIHGKNQHCKAITLSLKILKMQVKETKQNTWSTT